MPWLSYQARTAPIVCVRSALVRSLSRSDYGDPAAGADGGTVGVVVASDTATPDYLINGHRNSTSISQ